MKALRPTIKPFSTIIFLATLWSGAGYTPLSRAAPCCGSSSSLPALITGDETRKIFASFSHGTVIGDAPGAGGGVPIYRDPNSASEMRNAWALSYAEQLDELLPIPGFQVGLTLPVISNIAEVRGQSIEHTGLGDLTLNLGYELLPELEYSEWKPVVFTFAQVNLPTGQSLYTSTSDALIDVTSSGFYGSHLGVLAVKRWSVMDMSALLKLGRQWGRSFDSLAGVRDVQGAWTASWMIEAGVSVFEFGRVGLSLEGIYREPLRETLRQETQNGLTTTSSQRMVWNSAAQASWLLGVSSSVFLSYVDQTLFGPALNTSLSRSVTLGYSYRWDR